MTSRLNWFLHISTYFHYTHGVFGQMWTSFDHKIVMIISKLSNDYSHHKDQLLAPSWSHRQPTQPQLEQQISQFLCEKVMLYTIFTSFSSWFQQCSSWIDSKAENRGQPVLEHHRPSPPTCFGSNEGFESSFVTAKRGGRAWPRVP